MVLPSGITLPIYGSLGGADEGTREGEATIKGESTKGRDIGDIAKTGASGAVLGGLIRGRKGVAVGGGAGASIALADVLLTRGEDLVLPKGTELEIILDEGLEF
jgi:hypothetical protein